MARKATKGFKVKLTSDHPLSEEEKRAFEIVKGALERQYYQKWFTQFLIKSIVLAVFLVTFITVIVITLVKKNSAENNNPEITIQILTMSDETEDYKSLDCVELQQQEEVKLNNLMVKNPEPECIKLVDEKPNQEIKEVVPIIDETELYYLANGGWAEEGIYFSMWHDSKPEQTELVFKLAMSVMVHRAQVGYMGANTIKQVLYSNGQYARETIKKIEEGQEIPDEVYEWARDVYLNPLGPSGLIFQAEFTQGDEVYNQIGNQYFCVSTYYNKCN